MRKFLRNIKGMILAEALVSVGILASGAIIAGVIINIAVPTTALSRNYLVAQNLLDEETEVLNGVIATNWMNFPDQKECWLSLDRNDCSAKVAKDESYIVQLDSGGWKLQPQADCGVSDITTKNTCSLSLKTTTFQDGSKMERYVPYEPSLKKSHFFRAIKAVDVNDDRAAFEARIQWKEGSKEREIKRTVQLFNYIK